MIFTNYVGLKRYKIDYRYETFESWTYEITISVNINCGRK